MDANEIIDDMRAYYAKQAPFHDHLMGYISNEAMERLLGPIIRWFEDYVRGKDVLEVACGTGNWTQVLAKRARSVLATDVCGEALDIARAKPYTSGRVRFEVADAYGLDRVGGVFSAAFAADWWSHIPKSEVPRFLNGLAARLAPKSWVVALDMMPREIFNRMFSHLDEQGNRISRRQVASGESFYVVRNFPTERELRDAVAGRADLIDYRVHEALGRWMLAFRLRP